MRFYYKVLMVVFSASIFLLPSSRLFGDSLTVDTDYRLRGINYSNLDYDKTTSTDALNFYDQRLQISIKGKFGANVEIGSKITAIGFVGTTTNYFNAPYPLTNFIPYIENAYVRMLNIADSGLDLTAGKIPMEYADGLIISDNGMGFNALKLSGSYVIPVPLLRKDIPFKGEIFTARVPNYIRPEANNKINLYGGTGQIDLKKGSLFDFGFFEERDYTGTEYTQGVLSSPTRSILKQYYDFKLGTYEKQAEYSFELIKQNGQIIKDDMVNVKLDGMAYKMAGKLIGDNTRLGRVEAKAFFAINSGDDNVTSLDDADESFSPSQTKRWDGFEQGGYGELFGATPQGSFKGIPGQYSGVNTLSLGADFSPLYAWTFGVNYYLYSASMGPNGGPPASGFERIFGAEYSLGIEMDLSAKLVLNKYTEMKFSYDRYTPPSFLIYWPKLDPLDRYALEVLSRF
ncbi:MAG: hypothetical protein ABII64_07060 [Elusimicrobiota bacterium]